jgi:sporulation integral membrane protein YlbJ
MPGWDMVPKNEKLTLLLGIMTAVTVIFIILFPDKVFQASLNGLTLWWEIVFPTLLPFLIISEILMAYGFVHTLGVLFNPLMRYVFRLPGIGGWALAAGLIAGFPAGAKIAARLRQEKLISRHEGEMLLVLTNIGSPILMINIIAASFLHHSEWGLILLAAQILSLFAVGFILNLICGKIRGSSPPVPRFNARLAGNLGAPRNEATLGKILGEAVTSSVQTLMMIGGYIMIFSVLIKVLELSNILYVFELIISFAAALLQIDGSVSGALVTGIFEVHLGAFEISKTALSPQWQAAVIGGMLGWSGLAMHAQVKHLIHSTDLRYTPYLFARILHALAAFAATLLLWKPLMGLWQKTSHVFLPLDPANGLFPFPEWNVVSLWKQMFFSFLMLLCCMLLISALILLLKKSYSFVFKE